MRKFIVRVTDDIQEVIEARTVVEAKRKYAEIRAESGEAVAEASTQVSVASSSQRKGLYEHLLDLKIEGFFANPQPLGSIKAKLQEKTLHYPTTTFPPYLNRLIRERILRRFKQNTEGKEAWVYVNH